MGFFGSKNNSSPSNEQMQRKIDALESALEKQKMNLSLSKSNNTGLQQNLAEYKTRVKKQEKEILRLIQGLIPAEYIQERKIHPDIDDWEIDRLVDFTIETVKNKHNSLIREKTDLKKQVRILKEEKAQLNSQLESYLNNKKELFDQQENVDVEGEIVSGVEREDFDEPEMQPPPPKKNDESENEEVKFKSIKKAVENKMKNKEKEPKEDFDENDSQDTSDDLRTTAENMDAGHWSLLEAIGKYGFYRNKELEKNNKIQEILETNYSFNNHLSFLISENILEIKEEDLFIGVRGHSYNTFILTDKGKKLFKSKFNMRAKPSMRDWLINEHTNLKHGILIHDTAIVFENYGYDVFMDRETNTIKVSNEADGERVVFDLTIKQGPVVKHIEVERGNHKQSDFEKKLQKISDVTSSFYFVVHNNKTKDTIKAKYSKWIAKMKDKQKRQQYQFNIITLEELKKDENNWEIIKLNR